MPNLKVIHADAIFIGDGSDPRLNCAVITQGMKIVDIMPQSEAPHADDSVRCEILTPGFIDLQLNGAGGVQFNDDWSLDALGRMACAAQKGGTAWFFPTFITDTDQRYLTAITAAEAAVNEVLGVIGLHLEGPFLSPTRPGIHPPNAIRPIDDTDVRAISSASVPILLTLAPEETKDEILSELHANGTIVFVGHSDATYEEIIAAKSSGLSGATHLFNAMSQMGSRAPGVVGAVLDDHDLYAGIIADGVHVHDANLRTAYAHLGPERLFLVTDAMKPLGTSATEFELLGRRISRTEGRLCSKDGVLAGADISMIDAVRKIIDTTKCSVSSAIQMATQTPAKAVGLDSEYGTIAPGRKAGFTVLTADLSVKEVLYGNP